MYQTKKAHLSAKGAALLAAINAGFVKESANGEVADVTQFELFWAEFEPYLRAMQRTYMEARRPNR